MYKNYEDLPGVLSVKELKDYLEKRSVQPLSSMDSYQRAYINSMYSDPACRVPFVGGER